jgi:hypothetical protein
MAKVPGATPVKSRLHTVLTEPRATELYRCFLLDRLDALAGVPGIVPVVAFTPPEAPARMAALAPPSFRLIAQEREAPRPELFGDVPWSTADVLAVTLDRARGLGLRVRLLPAWFDVDTEADLRRLREELAVSGDGPARTAAFVRKLGR